MVTTLAANLAGCAKPVLECEPDPVWTARSTRLDLDAGYPLLLGISDETVLVYRDTCHPECADKGPPAIEFVSGTAYRELVLAKEGRVSGGAVVLGGGGSWVAIDDSRLVEGDLANTFLLRVMTSPANGRYRVWFTGEPRDHLVAWYPLWSVMSEHTFRTQGDAFKLDQDLADYKVVPVDGRIVRGASSRDEKLSCLTVEYEEPYNGQPGRYGLHCIDWDSRPRSKPEPRDIRPGLLTEADVQQWFSEPVTVVPLSLSDLRYVPAKELDLTPLAEFAPNTAPLNVVATRCGFWANDENNVYYSSGGRFASVPINSEPLGPFDWESRKLVFGPQSAASIVDGVLTQLLPHALED